MRQWKSTLRLSYLNKDGVRGDNRGRMVKCHTKAIEQYERPSIGKLKRIRVVEAK